MVRVLFPWHCNDNNPCCNLLTCFLCVYVCWVKVSCLSICSAYVLCCGLYVCVLKQVALVFSLCCVVVVVCVCVCVCVLCRCLAHNWKSVSFS